MGRYFTSSELDLLKKKYRNLERGGFSISEMDVLTPLTKSIGVKPVEIENCLTEMGVKKDEHVTFDKFILAAENIKRSKGQREVTEDDKSIRHHGYEENYMHTINPDENSCFTEHINTQFKDDPLLHDILPLDPGSYDMIEACKDGIILSKLLNLAVPGSLDERALNLGRPPSKFQMYENNNLVINTAKAIGIYVINIGAEDIMDSTPHLVLGLIWQIIKMGLQENVALKKHPELYRLIEDGETLESFLRETPESNLIRWINYHIKDSPIPPITNITTCLKDGKVYAYLLNKLAPDVCGLDVLDIEDELERCDKILKNAEKLGCKTFLTPKGINSANPKLNFTLLATLFDKVSGLESLDKDLMNELDHKLFKSSEHNDREARALLLWLNSIIDNHDHIYSFDGLLDGIPLLKSLDKVYPGIVDWKKHVNLVSEKGELSRFCKLENTNYAVYLAKSVGQSLVGIQGSDITEGSIMAIKSIIWQLMRAHMLKTLHELSDENGAKITDSDIIDWANRKVESSGSDQRISSFKDSSISTGRFLLCLLNAIKPGSVDWKYVKSGAKPEDAKLNSQYAISIARKIGATIFTLPDDIVEVKPKMILTFIGVLMALEKRNSKNTKKSTP